MAKQQFSVRLDPDVIARMDQQIEREERAFKKETGITVEINRAGFIRSVVEDYLKQRAVDEMGLERCACPDACMKHGPKKAA